MKYKYIKVIALTLGFSFSVALGCLGSVENGGEIEYGLFALSENAKVLVPDITDFKSAEAYAKKMGYYDDALCQSYLKGGEQVWYSGSYGIDGEAGQAYGSLVKKNIGGQNRFYFEQKGMTTTQAMLPPGLSALRGESRWDMGRYQRILADIAFGRNSTNGPHYESIRGEVVSQLTGGTAGGKVTYGEALKISLKNSKTGTDTTIIFVKNQGPRIMEFREGARRGVGGTAKVYIGRS